MTMDRPPAASTGAEDRNVAAPTWRDPWAWLSAGSVLLLLLRTRGAPRGVPVAEDFDFLHRALLEPGFSLLDGGGSTSFWRPVSHQLYYETFGSLVLSHPAWVGAIHAAMLALAAVLLYRTFRLYWDGPSAAAAASFPILAESTRTLIGWPSHFVDLGAFLFLALALHERVRGRPWSAWLALLAALLSKELALVGALLLPFVPAGAVNQRRSRAFWLAGTGVVIVLWAGAYAWVRAHAGLELPHGLERDPTLLSTPAATRLAWAVWNSFRATFSLSLTPTSADVPAAVLGIVLGLAALVVIGRDRERQERLAHARGWIAGGLLWCVLSWAALASIYPLWAPNRSQLGSLGLGIALVALLRIAHPGLIAALVVGRLVLFALGPATPVAITPEPDQRGAFMDYTRLVRLQKLMEATRAKLLAADPNPAPGTAFGWYSLPLSSEYAFGGPRAVQAWYRDSTLRFVSLAEFKANPGRLIRVFVSYQPPPNRAVVLIETAALRAQLDGVQRLLEGRWAESIADLRRSDSLQRDRDARVFLGDNAGRRAYGWAQLRNWEAAESEAKVALAAAREDVGARVVLATVEAVRHEREAAIAQLDTVLAMAPGSEEARELRDVLRDGALRDSTRHVRKH